MTSDHQPKKYHISEILDICRNCPDINGPNCKIAEIVKSKDRHSILPKCITSICDECEELSGVQCTAKGELACIKKFNKIFPKSEIIIHLKSFGTSDEPQVYDLSELIFVDLSSNPKCARCGEDRYQIIQTHHINKNRKDNRPENLIQLCANCHIGLHSGLWKLKGIEYAIRGANHGASKEKVWRIYKKIQQIEGEWVSD